MNIQTNNHLVINPQFNQNQIFNSTLNDTMHLSAKMHTSTHVQKGEFKNLFKNDNDKQKMRQS